MLKCLWNIYMRLFLKEFLSLFLEYVIKVFNKLNLNTFEITFKEFNIFFLILYILYSIYLIHLIYIRIIICTYLVIIIAFHNQLSQLKHCLRSTVVLKKVFINLRFVSINPILYELKIYVLHQNKSLSNFLQDIVDRVIEFFY